MHEEGHSHESECDKGQGMNETTHIYAEDNEEQATGVRTAVTNYRWQANRTEYTTNHQNETGRNRTRKEKLRHDTKTER